MAKKTSSVDPEKVEAILIECALAVGRGIGQQGTKTISRAASETWRKEFRGGIVRALKERNSWLKARKKALLVATNMGVFAAKNEPDPSEIKKATAVKAVAEARKDPNCPPPAPGSGRFCQ